MLTITPNTKLYSEVFQCSLEMDEKHFFPFYEYFRDFKKISCSESAQKEKIFKKLTK